MKVVKKGNFIFTISKSSGKCYSFFRIITLMLSGSPRYPVSWYEKPPPYAASLFFARQLQAAESGWDWFPSTSAV
jgi:hypothetical protein